MVQYKACIDHKIVYKLAFTVNYKINTVIFIFTAGTPRPAITLITAKSITLSWSPVNMANRYHVSYRREDLSISLPSIATYIRSRGNKNRSVTLQDLEPGASYRISVWDFQYIYYTEGAKDHKVSSPFEMTVTTNESGMFTVSFNSELLSKRMQYPCICRMIELLFLSGL